MEICSSFILLRTKLLKLHVVKTMKQTLTSAKPSLGSFVFFPEIILSIHVVNNGIAQASVCDEHKKINIS